LESISLQDVGRSAAGSRATSRMKAAPRSQSGKTTLWYSVTSGSGLTRTMAEITTPRQPSLPKITLGSETPVEVRPKALCDGSAPASPWRCHSMPSGVATRTSRTMSSMLP